MPGPEQLELGAQAAAAVVRAVENAGLDFASVMEGCGDAARTDAGAMRFMLRAQGLTSPSADNVLLDSSKILQLEANLGCENIDVAARRVAGLSTNLGRSASLRWNGIDVPVAPGDSAQAIRKAYDAGWEAEMNSPARQEADRLLVAKIAAEDAKRAAANRQAVEELRGVPARSESELIPALQSDAKNSHWAHWFPYALSTLRNPAEMKTAANYYARELPGAAVNNFAAGIGRYAPNGTEDAWREALAQMPKSPAA